MNRLDVIQAMKSLAGKTISGTNGKSYGLRTIEILDVTRATAEVEGGLLARLWCLPDFSQRTEWDRSVDQFSNPKVLSLCRIALPECLLMLEDPFRGYITIKGEKQTPLSRYTQWNGVGNWRAWYAQAGLRTRLILAARLAQTVQEWSYAGIARREWDLERILACIDKRSFSVLFPDVENFCVPSRAINFALSFTDVLAPELILQQFQPSPQTDSFTLGAVLYLLLRGLHPFGYPGAQKENIYKRERDNRSPNETSLPFSMFTERLSKLFERCFGEGRLARLKRPLASEWYEACLLAVDQTTECRECKGAFYAPGITAKTIDFHCPFCDQILETPIVLNFVEAVQIGDNSPLLGELWDCGLIIDSQGRTVLGRHAYSYSTKTQGTKRIARVELAKRGILYENLIDEPVVVYAPMSSRPSKLLPGKSRQVPVGSWLFFEKPRRERAVRGFRVQRSGEKPI